MYKLRVVDKKIIKLEVLNLIIFKSKKLKKKMLNEKLNEQTVTSD